MLMYEPKEDQNTGHPKIGFSFVLQWFAVHYPKKKLAIAECHFAQSRFNNCLIFYNW